MTNKTTEAINKVSTTININDYLGWFEKIDLNTLLWQLIIFFVFFYFRKEIKRFLLSLIEKVPQIKNVGNMEFHLSENTKKEIAKNDKTISEEIENYISVINQDPNIAFLANYIEFNNNLVQLSEKTFPDSLSVQTRTKKLLEKLVKNKVLPDDILYIFKDIYKLRNQISHGAKPFQNFKDAEPYLKTVFLLRRMILDALKGGGS